jgi:beta-mannosidase|uniref:glycoside hydrolase family 2 protein n=1 Tax=Aquiluna sp. TaxID=2053504 RepID=UPI0040475F07
MEIVPIDSGWKFEFLEAGNLGAAVNAVEARAARGLGTPEGIELTKNSKVPEDLVGEFSANVPGDIHQDLMRHGLIDNPHLGLNEFRIQWIGRSKWKYKCEFEVSRIWDFNDLVFQGIDTIAEVYLNGQWILSARDMHLRYSFEATKHLQVGTNLLEVVFDSQEDWAEERQSKNGELPNAYSDPTNQIRKMASNYGWDWGPTLVTVGLWKPVELQQYSSKFQELRVLPTVESGQARLLVSGQIAGNQDDLGIRISVSGEEIFEQKISSKFSTSIPVTNVNLWWPKGYGEQNLYDVTIDLISEEKNSLNSEHRKLGFRKVEVVSEPDQLGRNFEIRVNEKRIWVRGANWIPAHTSISLVSKQLYEDRIRDATEANMNLLRVWGGGIFENDLFYEICDREGVLVWQDCLFACASYPEADEDLELIGKEIHQATERLAHHPSLAVWNGSNENIWGYFDWGWQEKLNGRAWGKGIYLDLIPSLLEKLDPTRPYQPSSPYSQTMEVHPNDPNHGTAHMWEPWNRQDYLTYLDSVPRFATEYGYQSPASYSTMLRAIGEDQLWEDSPGMRAHQKAMDGKAKLRRSVDIRFQEPGNFLEWHFLTQLEQARALTTAISHLRSHHSISSGSVIWQLNDCWPVSSWALVDFEGQRKPAWHAVRKQYGDVFASFQGEGPDLRLVVVNDSQQDVSIVGSVDLWKMAGFSEQLVRVSEHLPPNTSAEILLAPSLGEIEKSDSYLVFELSGSLVCKFFDFDKNLQYPRPEYELEIHQSANGLVLEIQALNLLRDVCLFPDRVDQDSSCADNFFTLTPGSSKKIELKTSKKQLFTEAVIRSFIHTANDQSK